MALSIIPLCLAAFFHATSGCAHPLPALKARGKGSKASGAGGSDALELDDYSAEGEGVDEDGVDEDGIQMTRTNIIIISVISGVSLFLIIGSIFLCVWVRRRRKRKAARTSFSEDTQYVPSSSPAGEHLPEYKTDEHQPLYSEQPSGLNIYHAQPASYVSHASHASHDSTHDQHLSLLSTYNNCPPPPYPNSYGNSPPSQYSPLDNQAVGCFDPSYPAPTATPNGSHYSTPLSGGEANAYYGR